MIGPDAYYERAALSCNDNFVGTVLVDNGNGIGSDNHSQRHDSGVFKALVVFFCIYSMS